jgi:adenylate cyclase
MDNLAEAIICQFDDFLLDFGARVLFRLDANRVPTPVPLGSRAFDILRVLIEHRGGFVSKQEMLDAVWPNIAVEENNLTVQMSALRRVLDRGRVQGSCIQTIPGRGYRLQSPVIYSASVTSIGTNTHPPAERSTPEPTDQSASTRLWPKFTAWAGVICLSIAALLVMLAWYSRRSPVTVVSRPRLSVVVLPFQNLSNNPADNYLAEGVTLDLTSDLAHLPEAFVIASSSARTYGRAPVDVRQLGRELGVRYAVEGGVSRVGDTLRVNAELVSTETGAQLWSDRFDEPIADLANGQEQVLGRMRDGLGIGLVEIEVARSLHEHPTKPDAFDLILRGRSLRNQPYTDQRRAQALALFEQALVLDPNSVLAPAWTAQMILNDKMDNGYWPDLETRDRVEALMTRARAIAPDSESVLTLSGWWQAAEGRCQDTLTTAKQLIEMFPNNKNFYYMLAECKARTGNPEEAIALMRKAARLSPRDPVMYLNYMLTGLDFMLLGYDKSAIEFLEQSLAVNPDAPAVTRHEAYRLLSAVYARSGQDAAAYRAAAEADRLWPFDTVRRHTPPRDSGPVYAAQLLRYREALRLAGERDHADEEADFGVRPDAVLHAIREGYTPTSAPGAATIHTADLAKLIGEKKPVVLDTLTYFGGPSLPGAIGLQNAGVGGTFNDRAQDRLRQKMQALTGGDLSKPIVAVGWNSERFDGRNLALRLVALGYTKVFWYRGGREAWEAGGLSESDLAPADW